MTLEVETVVAVSLMMAVFAAVAAVGTSVVLGAGFERLRAGFEIVSKQTGFFSDAIHKLEHKVEVVDKQANNFGHSISTLEAKVVNVGEQAGAFISTVQKLEQKVEIVDKQTGFFSDCLYRLEKKVETLDAQEQVVADKLRNIETADDYLIADKGDTGISENLLVDMASLAGVQQSPGESAAEPLSQHLRFNIPQNLSFDCIPGDSKSVRYH